MGNEPDEMENNTCSPSTEGVIENASFFVRVRTVNERTTVPIAVPFTASIVTD